MGACTIRTRSEHDVNEQPIFIGCKERGNEENSAAHLVTGKELPVFGTFAKYLALSPTRSTAEAFANTN